MTDSPPVAAAAEAAAALASVRIGIQASQYTLVAGFVIWLYDIFLTFDREVGLLWCRGGKLIKAAYLIHSTRFAMGALQQRGAYNTRVKKGKRLSDNRCTADVVILNLCLTTGTIVATAIFTFRLYIVLLGRRVLRLFLVGAVVASDLALVALVSNLLVVTSARTMSYSDEMDMCVSKVSPNLGPMYVITIFSESVIAFATLYHAVSLRHHRVVLRDSPTIAILNVLYKGGFWYYLYALCMQLALALVYWTAPKPLLLILCFLEYALKSTVTSRWFLEFRQALANSEAQTNDESIADKAERRASINVVPIERETYEM
ncbi:hypothetical protein PIIN_10183 [Serendipita indica DSM 11827]|uniref:DUF6533 domain-containing protein n=1 Tax=Serendipita indica (strain DSM 11827) TaxID=1109443 RepID=G4TXZ7_SERID|nr:hypothetical protein PIIN_10183 [Serendipita indica DSM 11827]